MQAISIGYSALLQLLYRAISEIWLSSARTVYQRERGPAESLKMEQLRPQHRHSPNVWRSTKGKPATRCTKGNTVREKLRTSAVGTKADRTRSVLEPLFLCMPGFRGTSLYRFAAFA